MDKNQIIENLTELTLRQDQMPSELKFCETIDHAINYIQGEAGQKSAVQPVVSLSECSPQGCAHERQENAEKDLMDLLCIIHRDGGHYIATHGYKKAYADARAIIVQLIVK